MMYTVHVGMSATDFRKDLFQVLAKVIAGETVEIDYKGSTVRLAPVKSGSKLARAKRQNTLLCDPQDIVHSDPGRMKDFEKEWRKDWKKI